MFSLLYYPGILAWFFPIVKGIFQFFTEYLMLLLGKIIPVAPQ